PWPVALMAPSIPSKAVSSASWQHRLLGITLAISALAMEEKDILQSPDLCFSSAITPSELTGVPVCRLHAAPASFRQSGPRRQPAAPASATPGNPRSPVPPFPAP